MKFLVDAHLLKGQPYKLLLVSTGNIRNADLLNLFARNLERIVDAFQSHSFVELDRNHLIIHQ
jgi:predicted nuclease of predicted toxin-antitoxin system